MIMKTPTKAQIKAEAKKLAAMKPKVRRMTAFGDDNHAAIEAQIEVLENDLSEDDIYNRANEETAAAEELWTERQRENATHARQWMDGEEKESPSQSWAGLAKKGKR